MRKLIFFSIILIPCSIGHFFEITPEVNFESGNQEYLGPKFLENISRNGRDEFLEIIHSDRLSQDEKNRILENWAKEFNLTDELSTWTTQIQNKKDMVMTNVQAVVANISTVYDQLASIVSNATMARREQHEQIDKLAETFPREVRALFFIARHYRPESNAPIFGNELPIRGDISQQRRIPNFFMRLPNDAKQSFFEILTDETLSQYETDKKLRLWAEEYQIGKKVELWSKQIQQQKDVVIENVNAVVANISNVSEQIESALLNKTLTRRAQHAQIDRLVGTFPREVRALFFIARHYAPEDTTPVFGSEQGSENKLEAFGFPVFKKQETDMGVPEGNENHEFAGHIDPRFFYRTYFQRNMGPGMRFDYSWFEF